MSADNTIIILGTYSQWDKQPNGMRNNLFKARKVYRVAHVQGWDQLEYLKQHQPYNVGAYLLQCFKDSKIHEDLKEAMYAANDLLLTIGYVEYGIQVLDTDYILYGD